jgi:hypothetical protein
MPMNRFAVEGNPVPARTDGPSYASIGRFDPADTSMGDVLFLAEDAALFTSLSAVLTAPFSQTDPETIVPVSPAPFVAEAGDLACAVAPSLMAGAVLQTDKGEVQAQDLRAGQRILTRDKGFQTVLWVGRREVTLAEMHTDASLCPVLIRAGALGPNLPSADMTVPQSQRLLVEGPRTRLMFGQREVFVPAAHLVGYPGISLLAPADVTYVQVLCAAHEVIWTSGIWGESLHFSPRADQQLTAAQCTEIHQILPVDTALPGHAEPARRTLRRNEADLLLA